MSFARKSRRKNDILREEYSYFYQQQRSSFSSSSSWSTGYGIAHQQQQQEIPFVQKPIFKFAIGTFFALAYFSYVSFQFESITKFAHLSELERELSLPPDTAFRYSFYKQICQSDSFLVGLASILREHRVMLGNNNSCPSIKSIGNPLQKYSLGPQVIIGGTFHFLKKVEKWKMVSKLIGCHSIFRWKGESFHTIEAEEDGESGKTTCASTSTDGRSLIYFYFNSIWVLESCIIFLLFYFGSKLSKSIFQGGVTVVLFIILHPQRTSVEWIFSFDQKIEWSFFLIQIFTISNLVLSKSHPRWTTVMKVALSTTALILASEKEGQWLLVSQLLIISLMEILGVVSPYVASLVIFGQLTGWQFATMLSFHLPLSQYSFFLKVLACAILTVYVIQPRLERAFKTKWEESVLVRRMTLIGLFHLILFGVSWSVSIFFPIWLKEDNRIPGVPFHTKHSLQPLNNSYSSLEQLKESYLLNIQNLARNNDTEMEQQIFTHLLNSCPYPTLTSWDSFLSKYNIHLLMSIYIGLVIFLLPSYYDHGKDPKEKLKEGNKKEVLSAFEPISSSCSTDNNDNISDEELWTYIWQLSTRLIKPDDSFIKKMSPVIIFSAGQLITFALFSVYLSKSWELLFISQLCILGSMLTDQKRITRIFNEFNERKPLISNKIVFHWLALLLIFLIFLAKGKHGSNEMIESSRAKFEIGNQRIAQLSEAIHWIQEKTNSSEKYCFAGLEIPLIYIHLTTRKSCLFRNVHYNHALEQFNSLQTPVSSHHVALQQVYGMFSRSKSIPEYHKSLKRLNATHLFLSRQSCLSKIQLNDQIQDKPSTPEVGMSFSFFKERTLHKNHADQQDQLLGIHYQRSCELSHLWNLMEGLNLPATSKIKLSKKEKIKDGDHTGRDQELLCFRLLTQPDIRPFKRVFENNEYTILVLSSKDKDGKKTKSNTTSKIKNK